jgi:hypothetical protein
VKSSLELPGIIGGLWYYSLQSVIGKSTIYTSLLALHGKVKTGDFKCIQQASIESMKAVEYKVLWKYVLAEYHIFQLFY